MPPGPKGTIRLIGLVGKAAWARVAPGSATHAGAVTSRAAISALIAGGMRMSIEP